MRFQSCGEIIGKNTVKKESRNFEIFLVFVVFSDPGSGQLHFPSVMMCAL